MINTIDKDDHQENIDKASEEKMPKPKRNNENMKMFLDQHEGVEYIERSSKFA